MVADCVDVSDYHSVTLLAMLNTSIKLSSGHSDWKDTICVFIAGVSNANNLGATGQVVTSLGRQNEH